MECAHEVSEPTAPAPGAGTPLRVASYNTRDFHDDRRAAARVVRAIRPDVLCLQEVPRRLLGAHQVRRFAAECGLSWSGSHRGSGGTTILTGPRVRPARTWHRRLSVALHRRTRGYALSRLVLEGGRPLVVASVHLSLDAGERHAHTTQILREVRAVAGDTAGIVLAGDLNEVESGSAWRLLDARLRLVSPAAPTFPARRPRTLLDVIFASPEVQALPHVEVALDEGDLVAASDHRPVWADLVV